VNAATISAYREAADRTEPRILLIVDGIGAFREAYEHIGHSTHYAMFNQIVADGRRFGLHVVVTGDRPGAMSTSLASMMQRRLILRLASADDYMLAGVPGDIVSANSPQGRGIIAGQEIQVAVFGGDENVAVQARAVDQLATRMRDRGHTPPEPVVRLSDHIALGALPVTTAVGIPAIGVADDTLAPVGVPPQGVLMVTGPPGSGRSTALLTLAQSVRRANPMTRIVHMTPAASTIAGLGVWSDTAVGTSSVIELANDLMSSHSMGAAANLMVVIESLADFGNTEAEPELARMVKTLADASAFVVGESEVSTWGQAWLLAQPFKSARRGLLLSPGGVEADTLLSTPIGTIRRHDFPPGRGVLIEKGKGVWMQVAQPVI
jgi:S-DNA-T family DNA segregation ATPase FtsK/SpoIIIE